jgi:hypothetical protein
MGAMISVIELTVAIEKDVVESGLCCGFGESRVLSTLQQGVEERRWVVVVGRWRREGDEEFIRVDWT